MDLYFDGDKSTMLIYREDLNISLLNYVYQLDEIKLVGGITYSELMTSRLFELLLPMLKTNGILTYCCTLPKALDWVNINFELTENENGDINIKTT